MPYSAANRAPYSRSNHIFFRHIGAERRDVYFRVNPQAIRVQQANKGSVVDTLGGYFREVMFAEDKQHNGLLLPDLTIECDTGAGYRKELKNLEWIWRNHATPQADGTPARTLFMDMVDEDTLWHDGGTAAPDPWSNGAVRSGAPEPPPNPANSMAAARQLIPQGALDFKTAISKTMRGTRFVPRMFQIEILAFAWDESVQDPYRIRFNFRCKILRDLFFSLDTPEETSGRVVQPLSDTWSDGGVVGGGSGNTMAAAVKGSQYPLNPGAHISLAARSANLLEDPKVTAAVNPIFSSILQATGLGQNQVLNTILDAGRSVFNSSAATDQRLSWRSEFSNVGQLESTRSGIAGALATLAGDIAAPLIQTYPQVGAWVAPAASIISTAVAALSVEETTIPPITKPAKGSTTPR